MPDNPEKLEPKKDQKKQPKNKRRPACGACGQPLGIPGGYAGTGLCGPCATGEANTISEIGETW